jgi:hypothetical protein
VRKIGVEFFIWRWRKAGMEQKTVKVRIAVAVDQRGDWYAGGDPNSDEQEMLAEARGWVHDDGSIATYFVEAELPLPVTPTVPGTATSAAP